MNSWRNHSLSRSNVEGQTAFGSWREYARYPAWRRCCRRQPWRRRILEEAHLPYVYVLLDPDDRIENDGHPDADGARMIAESMADALEPALAARADTLPSSGDHSASALSRTPNPIRGCTEENDSEADDGGSRLCDDGVQHQHGGGHDE